MDEKRDNRGYGSDPHEGEHWDANIGPQVELRLGGQGEACADAHGSPDDGRDADEDRVDERKDGHGQGPPAGAESDEAGEHEDKGKTDSGQEEAEHDVLANAENGQDSVDVGR